MHSAYFENIRVKNYPFFENNWIVFNSIENSGLPV